MITKREQIMNGSTVIEDVLVPSPHDDVPTPYPAIEYDVVMHTNLDKLIRDVNRKIWEGRQTEWWLQVSSWPIITYYQAIIRWNVDADYNPTVLNDNQYINGTNDEDDTTWQEDVWDVWWRAQPRKEV